MNRRSFVLFLLALFLTLPAYADPEIVFTHFSGYDDVNGNGQLDCAEPVTIEAGFSTAGHPLPISGATLTAPAPGTRALSYLPGSAFVTPDHAAGCFGTVDDGFDPAHDPTWTAHFSCDPATSNPLGTYFFSVTYRAIYTAPAGAPGFTSAIAGDVDSQNLLQTETQSFPTATCSSAATPLKIAKTAAGNAVPGSPLTFTLTATNASTLGVGGVQLVDTVPPNTAFSPALSTPGWVCLPNGSAGSMCRLPVGNIIGNASASAIFAVTVASPLAAGVASISNTGCVSEGPSQVDDCSSVSVPTAGTSVLSLTKSLVSGIGSPGATLVYNLAVQDTGNQGATNVILSEIVPANTTFSPSASAAGWQCSPSGAAGSNCTLALGTLQVGAVRSAHFAVVVDNPLPAGVQSIANTACAKSPDAPDDCHTVPIPTTGLPALNVTKTLSSGDGTPGTSLVYSVVVQNTGNQGASLVNLQEVVPAHTIFDPAKSDPAWTCSSPAAGSNCSLNLPTLAAGTSRTAPFAVTVDNPLPAGVMQIANTVCASASGVSITCSTVTVTPHAAPNIMLTKSYGAGPVHPGDHVSFTLTATNSGNQDSGPLTLTDTVPPYTTFDPAGSSPGWSCAPNNSAGSLCTLILDGLAVGARTTRTASFLVGTLPAGLSQVANTACIAESAPVARGRSRTSSTCSQATTPPEAKVQATLIATPKDDNHNGMVDPGETLAYTLELHCTSSTAANGLAITPHLDLHLHFVPGSVAATSGVIVSGNGASDTSFEVDLASLAPGASTTITFEAVIDPATTAKSVATQVFTAGTNFPLDASDDPGTPAPDDPTVTPISMRFIAEIPTLGALGRIALSFALACAGATVLWRYRL